MSIFNVLSLIGGLCLFLFGMNVMGQSLERRAGGSLKALLGKLTNKKFAGLLTGLGVTAVIQSSSATTVMVVGFVNSGLMSLKQSINVIMGATAWILSLAGISSDNVFIQLFARIPPPLQSRRGMNYQLASDLSSEKMRLCYFRTYILYD